MLSGNFFRATNAPSAAGTSGNEIGISGAEKWPVCTPLQDI